MKRILSNRENPTLSLSTGCRRLIALSAVLGILLTAPLLVAQDNDQEIEIDYEVSDEELEDYAELQYAVLAERIARSEQRDEIAAATGLHDSELGVLEQALVDANHVVEDVDSTYREDEVYLGALTEIAEINREYRSNRDGLVAESPLTEQRFEELAVIVSLDARLSAEANRLVSEYMERDREPTESE